jgi:fermentation-respiration switch protein FrsA (DUF1100 family)
MYIYIKRLVLLVLVLLLSGFAWLTYEQANNLINHPLEMRELGTKTPEDIGLSVQEVKISNPQGMRLYGYYGASKNGAYIMLQHGFKADRSYMLEEAKVVQDAGYGVLITSVRAHDKNDGQKITFGVREMQDLQAWYEYLMAQGAVPGKVGILGNSMGAAMAIEYAARNENIAAVVSVSGFSSLQDTINVSVEYFTGLPAFPFAPAITAWAQWLLDLEVSQVDATKAAAQLCQTPILVMQGGADTVVSVSSGQWIYDAACGPKELWFEEGLGHTKFDRDRPQEYAQRVTQFFAQHLL